MIEWLFSALFQCFEQSLEGEVTAHWSVRTAGTGNEGLMGKERSQTDEGTRQSLKCCKVS